MTHIKNLVLVFTMLLGSIFSFGQTPDTVEWRDGVWHVNKSPNEITEYDLDKGPNRAYDRNTMVSYFRGMYKWHPQNSNNLYINSERNDTTFTTVVTTSIGDHLVTTKSRIDSINGLFLRLENGVIKYLGNDSGDTASFNGDVYTAVDEDYLRSLEPGYHVSMGSVTVDSFRTLVTTMVTDMSNLFLGKGPFNQDISNWDVSNVTNMEGMFRAAESFNRNLSNWDVSNVTNMSNMFRGTLDFQKSLNDWNVSNVENMSYMFYASNFNSSVDKWDVSSVVNMNYMFSAGATFDVDQFFSKGGNFNQDISDWDVSNLVSAKYMFGGDEDIGGNVNSFNQDISKWDVSNLEDIEGLFYKNNAFNQDISIWDVSNVINMDFLFFNATAFNQHLVNWCVKKITEEPVDFIVGAISFDSYEPRWGQTCEKQYFFKELSGVIVYIGDEVGDTATIDGILYTTVGNSFVNTAPSDIDYTKIVTSLVTNMDNLFKNRSFGTFDPETGSFTMTTLDFSNFNEDISHWDVSNVTTMEDGFLDATSFNQDLSNWCVENISTVPTNFAQNASSWTEPKPIWGTCP